LVLYLEYGNGLPPCSADLQVGTVGLQEDADHARWGQLDKTQRGADLKVGATRRQSLLEPLLRRWPRIAGAARHADLKVGTTKTPASKNVNKFNNS
jgi:hypothetical protein